MTLCGTSFEYESEDGIQPQEEAHFAIAPFWVIRKALSSRHAAHAVLQIRRDGEGRLLCKEWSKKELEQGIAERSAAQLSRTKGGKTSRASHCVPSVTLV